MPSRLTIEIPGDGKVPNSAVSVETIDGQIVYEGTPAEPIIKYEDCLTDTKQRGRTMRLWTVDLIKAEITGVRNKSCPSGLW